MVIYQIRFVSGDVSKKPTGHLLVWNKNINFSSAAAMHK